MLHRTRARDGGTLAAAAAGALAAAVVVSATIDPRDPNLFEFAPQIVPANAGQGGSEAGRAALRDRPRAYAARERASRSRRVRKTGRRERR